ncbi:MAG TPA: hypothetical protein VJK53_06205 [Candidatus Paceibacterota bacterium]
MKAKKITAADRKRMFEIVSKLKPEEKDEVLAALLLFAQRAMHILDELSKDAGLSQKEKKEIEDSITVGPQWLKFSRRIKRQK